MNPITELFAKLPNEELFSVVEEIQSSEKTGLVGDLVRKYTDQVCMITNESVVSTHLFTTQVCILKEAAFRWVNSQK